LSGAGGGGEPRLEDGEEGGREQGREKWRKRSRAWYAVPNE